MPEKALTVAQRSTLLALMIKASPLPRTFLADVVKISLDKPRRDDLVDRKLITVTEKPLVLELTEGGWAAAIAELDGELPDRAGALGGTLFLLLGFLREYLDRNDLSAAEFFAPGVPDVEAQIRKAYGKLAGGAGAYVMLDTLREALGDTPRPSVDAALLRLDAAEEVHLVPESNQKALTPAERAAAIRIGSQDMHLIAIRS